MKCFCPAWAEKMGVIVPDRPIIFSFCPFCGARLVEDGATEPLESELTTARHTIQRLNRRVQIAEAGIAEKVNGNAGGSLGRALANAAATMYAAELEALRAAMQWIQDYAVLVRPIMHLDDDDPSGAWEVCAYDHANGHGTGATFHEALRAARTPETR